MAQTINLHECTGHASLASSHCFLQRIARCTLTRFSSQPVPANLIYPSAFQLHVFESFLQRPLCLHCGFAEDNNGIDASVALQILNLQDVDAGLVAAAVESESAATSAAGAPAAAESVAQQVARRFADPGDLNSFEGWVVCLSDIESKCIEQGFARDATYELCVKEATSMAAGEEASRADDPIIRDFNRIQLPEGVDNAVSIPDLRAELLRRPNTTASRLPNHHNGLVKLCECAASRIFPDIMSCLLDICGFPLMSLTCPPSQ